MENRCYVNLFSCRQQILQFRPPLEDIRTKYYGQLKRYLNIPNLFRGVSESGDNLIFPVMIERYAFTAFTTFCHFCFKFFFFVFDYILIQFCVLRNAHRFADVFAKAEELFSRLEALRERWIPWVSLGAAPLEQLVQEHLHSWQDWDNNFKASKNWGQQIAKLPRFGLLIFLCAFLIIISELKMILIKSS